MMARLASESFFGPDLAGSSGRSFLFEEMVLFINVRRLDLGIRASSPFLWV